METAAQQPATAAPTPHPHCVLCGSSLLSSDTHNGAGSSPYGLLHAPGGPLCAHCLRGLSSKCPCGRAAVSSHYGVCREHFIPWDLYTGERRPRLTRHEWELLALLYAAGGPLTLHPSSHALVRRINTILRLKPGVDPILTLISSRFVLNQRFVAEAASTSDFFLDRYLTHPRAFTFDADTRTITDRRAGCFTGPPPAAEPIILPHQLTAAELSFAALLSSSRLNLEAYPQVRVGGYVADFLLTGLCLSDGRLFPPVVIEIDGSSHNSSSSRSYDKRRTANLRALGYEVVRFTNDEVFNSPGSVLTALLIIRGWDASRRPSPAAASSSSSPLH